MYLNGNEIESNTGSIIAKSLQFNSSLITLHMGDNLLDDVSSISLASNSFLTTLHLDNNLISHSGIAAIAKTIQTNSSLTELYLDDRNKVIDDVLERNRSNQRLRQMNLQQRIWILFKTHSDNLHTQYIPPYLITHYEDWYTSYMNKS